MLRHAFRATSLCVLFLAAVWGFPAYAISKDFNQSYPLQPGGTFELQNVIGTVEVQGWDRDEVEIHAVKTAKQRESDLDRVSIEVDARLDAISVATRYPQNEGVEVAVEYTVNGNIEVFEAGGSVHAHTTNGNVHLELTHLREKDKNGATAETTNGSLVLAVPSDMQADVESRCLHGNFFSELPITMESTQRPREMHGKLGRGGAPIHLRTVNGGIRLIVLRSTV